MNDEIEEKITSEFQAWMPSLPGAGAFWRAWSIPNEPVIEDPISGGKSQDVNISEREKVYLEMA